MENENKEKVILTDEELKEVAGGKISAEAVIKTVVHSFLLEKKEIC